ncbi:hypothetical protein [Teichococcus aerofrigidensis]
MASWRCGAACGTPPPPPRPGAPLTLTASPAVLAALRDWPGALEEFHRAAGPLHLRPDPLCPPGQEHVHAG